MDEETRNLIPSIPDPFECHWEDCEAEYASAQYFYWHIEAHAQSAQEVCVNDKVKYKCGWEGDNIDLKFYFEFLIHQPQFFKNIFIGSYLCEKSCLS